MILRRENHMHPERVATESEQLVAINPIDDLDPYEAKYMNAGDALLYRSKARMTWQWPAITGGWALFLIIFGALRGKLILGLGFGALLILVGLFFQVMRVMVTTSFVEVHYGFLGPRIPIEAIESAETIVHDSSFLRWGITPNSKGEWLYVVAGDKGRAVKIVWRNARGRRRVHIIGSHEPEQLAAAIQQARAALGTVAAAPQLAVAPTKVDGV